MHELFEEFEEKPIMPAPSKPVMSKSVPSSNNAVNPRVIPLAGRYSVQSVKGGLRICVPMKLAREIGIGRDSKLSACVYNGLLVYELVKQ